MSVLPSPSRSWACLKYSLGMNCVRPMAPAQEARIMERGTPRFQHLQGGDQLGAEQILAPAQVGQRGADVDGVVRQLVIAEGRLAPPDGEHGIAVDTQIGFHFLGASSCGLAARLFPVVAKRIR